MDTDWNERYRAEDTPWDKGKPAPGLVDWLAKRKRSPDTRVLVPGCGKGHEAAAWAEAGFTTTGMDLSDLALSEARAKYEALSNLAFTHGNFLEDKPREPYDLVFEHTLYCAINPERRDEYTQSLLNWLAPGGQLLAIHFVFPLTNEGPPFGASRNEIVNRFSSDFELIKQWKPRHFEGREDEELMFFWQRKS
jgi:SAM-dependent methyltransferase